MNLNRRELIALPSLLAADFRVHAAVQASPQFPGPDLANLHGFMDWIAGQNSPRLSFLDARWNSLERWKSAARPVFLQHLRYEPAPDPLSAQVVRSEQRDGFSIETVKIRATAGYDIPARVLLPANRKGKAPGVVAIHCHSGRYVWGHEKIISDPDDPPVLTEFRDRAYGRPYAEVLARRGYVVLVTDGFYFGERRLRPEEIDPESAPGDMRELLRTLAKTPSATPDWFALVNRICGQYEHLTAKTIFSAGATWPGILAWDDRRSVDYLCSRPEVDPGRIGCVGLSIGGLRTAHLIAADPRIKVACVTGWMTLFREQLRNHLRSHTWMIYIPGLYRHLDLPDAAALHAPGPLLVQQCSRDALYPMAGMKGAVDKLKAVYAKAGIPERFRGTFYDVPHSFRPEMQDEAFEWLERWL